MLNTGFTEILSKLAERSNLSLEESQEMFGAMLDGHILSECMAAFLMALRVKGATREELLGAVKALRARMRPFPAVSKKAIDVCGTGGDRYGTLNISTAVAFVLAGLGVPVVKHGNRAVSSRSGASDILSALRVPFMLDPEAHVTLLREYRVIFLAASQYCPTMPTITAVRQALRIPTLFNIMGPLVNPAGVTRQLVGVFSCQWLELMVDVLRTLGSEHVWAVCSTPLGDETKGVDELTLAGPTHVVALERGRYDRFVIDPEMAGFSYAPIEAIKGGDPSYNAERLEALLRGASGVYRDTVLLNAACALHVAGEISVLRDGHIDFTALRKGVAMAAFSLDSGQALAVIKGLRSFSTMRER